MGSAASTSTPPVTPDHPYTPAVSGRTNSRDTPGTVTPSRNTPGMTTPSRNTPLTPTRHKPTGLTKPMLVLSSKGQSASHLVRTNEVAPIIIKNCREEFQQTLTLTEPLIYGRLKEGMTQHPLIMGRCILVRDDYQCEDTVTTTPIFLAANYRQAREHFPVFGMGQPTRNGLDNIVDSLHQQGFQWITLFSLRRESVFFAHEEDDMVPYSLRTVDNLTEMFVNSAPGVTAADEEVRVRKEMLDFASLKDTNHFFFYKNLEHTEHEPHLLPVQFEDDVQLLEEIYARKAFSDPHTRYKRLGFPPHGPPPTQTFDSFLNTFKECPTYFSSSPTGHTHATVFCCHTGRVPSTLGMVMACLLEAHKHGFPTDLDADDDASLISEPPDYNRGQFCAIIKLVQSLPNGATLKSQVDYAIDLCSDVHNTRTAIKDTKLLLEGISHDYIIEGVSAKQFLRQRCTAYLDSYFMLICFNAYLSQQFRERFIVSFSTWMRRHPDLMRLHSHLDVSHITAPVNLLTLGVRSLVSDDYIGLDVLSSQMDVGVSNFRRVTGFPVYGMAQPRIQGLSRVVKHLMTKKQWHPSVLLINLRDDVCLECDDQTYNIRETENLGEAIDLTGISAADIQAKETELKSIIFETTRAFMVYTDIADPPKSRQFNTVISMQDIAHIQQENTSEFDYRRMPMSGETAPNEKTFDAIVELLTDLPDLGGADSPALVFSCRTGKSRTTTSMTIACLMVCHRRGFPYGAKLGEQERISVPNAQYTKGDYLRGWIRTCMGG